MKDLTSVYQLQSHFDDAHSDEFGNKDVVQQLKGLFGKAKKKILQKIEGTETETHSQGHGGISPEDEMTGQFANLSTVDAGGFDITQWEPQEMGTIRSYTDAFRGVRDTRIDWFVVETNKLLIRLEKLLGFESQGMDSSKRKAFEKSIVPWAPDDDVKFCPTCGDKFSLAKRKHHCRLCGTIMCNRCSEFLPVSVARTLTKSNHQSSPEKPQTHRRQASGGSVDDEPEFRICQECEKILIRKAAAIKEKTTKPLLVQLYEKLRMSITDVENVVPTFTEMALSLNAGETSYNLDRASIMRMKLLKMYELIDSLSKTILSLGVSGETQPNQTTLKLQRMVRQSSVAYLQDTMLTLPSLPSPEQFEKVKAQREAAIARKLEEQRQAAVEEQRREQERKEQERRRQERFRPQFSGTPVHFRGREEDIPRERTVTRESVGAEGWGPTQVPAGTAAASNDPMLQQMDIIRGYIQQAREAQKHDEVQMLESNLRELQSEYWRQQQSQMQNEIDRM
ncbi:rabenosyn-5-like [Glandiceps talaboti]